SSAVARLSLDFIDAPPIQVSRSFRSRRSHPRQQGPQQPTRSGRSLFPATPMISGAAIAVGYRLRPEVDPSESRLNRDACPKPTPRAARCRALQACHRWCASDASRGQDESNRTVHRRLSTRLRPRAVSHSAGSVGPEDLVTFGNFPAPVCLEMGEMLAEPPFG